MPFPLLLGLENCHLISTFTFIYGHLFFSPLLYIRVYGAFRLTRKSEFRTFLPNLKIIFQDVCRYCLEVNLKIHMIFTILMFTALCAVFQATGNW